MSTNHHTAYQDGVTEFTASDMNAPLGQLDAAIDTYAVPYMVAGYWAGVPAASEIILAHVFAIAVTFPSGLGTSKGKAQDAATAQAVFDIKKNGSNVGTMTFAGAGTVPTFAMGSSQSFAIGDVLTIVAPASPDATLGRIAVTLRGSK